MNYLGGVWCTRAFMPGLEAALRVTVAHTSSTSCSVAGTVAFAPAGAYAASKHAQLAFSRSLSAALRGTRDPRAHVLPGFVETEGLPAEGRAPQPAPPPLRDQHGARCGGDRQRRSRRDKREITLPWFPYRLVSIAQTLTPGLVARFSGMAGYRPGSFSPGDPGGVPD